MNKIIILLLAALTLSACSIGTRHEPKVVINNSLEYKVRVAKTEEEKQKGLSGTESLEEKTGMIFIFERPVQPTFWMREMKYSLDAVWINNGVVVDLSENIPTPPPVETFEPEVAITEVLEIPAGDIERYEIKVGQHVDFFGLP